MGGNQLQMSSHLMGLVVLAFISTTVDDFAVLMVMFGRVLKDKDLKIADRGAAFFEVVLGQCMSFTIICSFSLLGLILGNFAPSQWVGLIGIVPTLIGIKALYDLITENYFNPEVPVSPATGKSELVLTNNVGGENEQFETDKKANEIAEEPRIMAPRMKSFDRAVDVANHSVGILERENSLRSNKSAENGVGEKPDTQPRYLKFEAVEDVESQKQLFTSSDNIVDKPKEASVADVAGNDVTRHEELTDPEEEEENLIKEEEMNFLAKFVLRYFGSCLKPRTLETCVAGLIVGSDNIAIYLAIFAEASGFQVLLVLIIFYAMLIAFVGIALATILYVSSCVHILLNFNALYYGNLIFLLSSLILKCKCVSSILEKYSDYFIPYVLIAVGILILKDSVLFNPSEA